MRLFRPIFIFLAAWLLMACSSQERSESPLRILGTTQASTLPSASGITASGNRFFVNSDNAPFLYVLNDRGALVDSIPILNENRSLHEIPKPEKSDYEAATMLQSDSVTRLLLLGSGSMSPHRDSALLMTSGAPSTQQKASLRPFYDELTRRGIPAKSINIEAAASYGDDLILFNRGDNRMIAMNADSFLGAVFGGTGLPAIRMQQVRLPAINGFTPGISGATMLNDSTVLFCGSVEATTDWAKDGDILGSGVGIIRLTTNHKAELLQWTMLKDAKGVLLREKLEGIELLRYSKRVVSVRCVTDNDNGSSTLIDLELRLP